MLLLANEAKMRALSVAAPQNLIDELPECLLVDILCRLPRNTIVQRKCVSKSWWTLISKPSFHAYFLSLQKQNPPFETTLMFVRTGGLEIESFTIPLEHIRVSRVLKFHHIYKVVAGTCNDLVLWCTTLRFQIRCYYISNPYTNHSYALPPAPQCLQAHALVGLVCDSYHRCKVVRILQCGKEMSLFKLQIFSSETSIWTEAVVPFPQGLTFNDIRSCVNSVGIACNGRLYWLVSSGLVLGLDPCEFGNSCIDSTSAATTQPNFHYTFISKPDIEAGLSASSSCEQCLAVFRGCLSLCQFYNGPSSSILYVWDLKEDDHEVNGVGGEKVQWCLREKIVLDKKNARWYWKPLAFHPNRKDILYTMCCYPRNNAQKSYLCTYNIRRSAPMPAIVRKQIPLQNRVEAFPLLIPRVRLPTPVRTWFPPPQQQFIRPFCVFLVPY